VSKPSGPLPAVSPGGEAVPVKERLKRLAHAAVHPVVRMLVGLGVRPDHLTVAGLILSVTAGVSFFEGGFRLGALFAALAGVCDILDGEIARATGGATRFGAFLDSTLDRLAEAAMLTGIAGFYLVHLVELVLDPSQAVSEVARGLEPRTWAIVALTAVLALVGSFMVSYTRARAEGLGLECRVGWFERPERVVLLIVGGLFGVGPVMSLALILLTLMSFATAAQRVAHVWKITRGAGRDGST
jgi:CDP-diacylglycerol--glycerol-3-phosphate 3-phosphatidyltransferase